MMPCIVCNTEESGGWFCSSHIARRFGALLDAYPCADGHRWSGQNLSDATGGMVSRSYVTNLRKGRIENLGYEKLDAIAKRWVSRRSYVSTTTLIRTLG